MEYKIQDLVLFGDEVELEEAEEGDAWDNEEDDEEEDAWDNEEDDQEDVN